MVAMKALFGVRFELGVAMKTKILTKLMMWATCGALSLGVSADAWGIIMRDDVSDEKYIVDDADYPALVDLFQPGDCIGTLIHPEYLLTVAHCAQDMNLNRALTVNGVVHDVAEVILHPDWDDWNDDIALIRFEEAVEGVDVYRLYQDNDEEGQTMTLVGRGLHGTGIEGESGATQDELLRRAHNVVSTVNNQWIEVRFESPDEAEILPLEGVGAAGDSGSPAFIEKDGEMLIAGLNSWGDGGRGIGISEYGSFDYSTRVSLQLEFVSKYVDLTEPTETTGTETTDTGYPTMTITTTTTVAPETDGDGNEEGEAESSGCGCNNAQGAAYWLALLPMLAFVRRHSISV
jgi:hypothetical protein